MNKTKEGAKVETKRVINGHTHHKCQRCGLFRPLVAKWAKNIVCMFCLKDSD